MKYILKKDGEETEVVAERWSWGVLYRPTEEAIKRSELEMKKRNEILEAERKARIDKVKKDPAAIQNLNNYFDVLVDQPMQIEQGELHQFQEDGSFHQFAEINQDEVELFSMFRLDDMSQRFDMLTQGKQIFHFYRHTIFSAATPEERRAKVYCFGWKDKETGATAYHYILPNDRLVISDKDIDITKFGI